MLSYKTVPYFSKNTFPKANPLLYLALNRETQRPVPGCRWEWGWRADLARAAPRLPVYRISGDLGAFLRSRGLSHFLKWGPSFRRGIPRTL